MNINLSIPIDITVNNLRVMFPEFTLTQIMNKSQLVSLNPDTSNSDFIFRIPINLYFILQFRSVIELNEDFLRNIFFKNYYIPIRRKWKLAGKENCVYFYIQAFADSYILQDDWSILKMDEEDWWLGNHCYEYEMGMPLYLPDRTGYNDFRHYHFPNLMVKYDYNKPQTNAKIQFTPFTKLAWGVTGEQIINNFGELVLNADIEDLKRRSAKLEDF